MNLSGLSEYTPLQILKLNATNKNYFAKSKAGFQPPPTKDQGGFQGGQYGGQSNGLVVPKSLNPRQQKFFGGAFGH